MANNDEYTDEYNDEYLYRDFFVGFNFWSRLSFQISEFRVHWAGLLVLPWQHATWIARRKKYGGLLDVNAKVCCLYFMAYFWAG